MALTPADVHNVAFSRPRIGKRGYNEQEVDLFIDLVEQELTRHLTEDAQLRRINEQLRNRTGGQQHREEELAEQEAKLAEREARLVEREAVLRRHVRKHEVEVRQQKAELAEREAKLAQRGTPLPQQVAQLRFRESQVAQREAQAAERENELSQREDALSQREGELAEVAPRAGAENVRQLTARPKPVAVNGSSRLEEIHAVDSIHGRHDMERMAIRAITDALGNTVTETVHERTRRSRIDHDSHADDVERLKNENAELARSLGLLKSAAALLAAALDRP
jgi:DivIVA domain-containing protein